MQESLALLRSIYDQLTDTLNGVRDRLSPDSVTYFMELESPYHLPSIPQSMEGEVARAEAHASHRVTREEVEGGRQMIRIDYWPALDDLFRLRQRLDNYMRCESRGR